VGTVTVGVMRLLHTSDWHLGRTLHGVDLLPYQAAHLDHLVEVVRAERVDAVVVAGDVFDRGIPPVEAVSVLSDALARLAELTTVVVTSGNHDSAARLGFGSALMRERVALRTRVAALAEPVEVGDGLLIYGLPYLDPDFARAQLAEPVADAGGGRDERADDEARVGGADPAGPRLLARSHEAVLAAAMRRVRADRARRSADARVVVVAHAFVVGGAASESERDIRVGGVDQVPAGVLAGADYVALGHLHGPQRVAGPEGAVLRYSGSPLAFSFGEAAHHKSSALVDLSGAEPRVELVPAPVPRPLVDVSGTLEQLLGAAGEPYLDHWLRVTVTDEARPVDLFARLRARFGHVLVVQHQSAGGRERGGRAAAVTSSADPLVVATDFVRHVTGTAPTPAEAGVLRRAYEDVMAAERSA